MAEYIERTEELLLAMNAGARAIENTKRYHGAIYTNDVFSESPQEIPYLQAAKVLREVSDAPAADVAPVVYGRWVSVAGKRDRICSRCLHNEPYKNADDDAEVFEFCPHCGVKMDGGADNEA